MKKQIFLADLTHTASGIFAAAFPLGVSLVCSYAKALLGDEFDFKLFKIPDTLCAELSQGPVYLLGLSNYAWNMDLNYKFSCYAKSLHPDMAIVFGGPNFPIELDEKEKFLRQHPTIDFYIENDGELAFADLLNNIEYYDGNINELKKSGKPMNNCSYISGDQLIRGKISGISDLGMVPSPYLTGLLDDFFKLPMIPLIETTRGCPFSCLYCADGVASKNKIRRHHFERTQQEIDYISDRVNGINMLMISDLNFGMYKEDIATALHIRSVQRQKCWPVMIGTATGKNNTETVREVVTILGDSFRPGASIQSSDKKVLKNIKRDHFNRSTFEELIRLGNALGAHSYSDIILALPGDTKETHFESIRYCIDHEVSQLNLYQAILLHGAEMSTKAIREKYRFETRFRIRQGTIGFYNFGDRQLPVCETEEIVVASKDMTFSDYTDCRVMDLIVETFVNCALYEEVFVSLRMMKVSVFDIIYTLYAHQDELFTPQMKAVFESFIGVFMKNLYPSREVALERVIEPASIAAYLDGTEGGNELLDHKAMLYLKLEEISSVLLKAIRSQFVAKGLFREDEFLYLEQLIQFIVLRKKDFRDFESKEESYFDYDFQKIAESNYLISREDLRRFRRKTRFKFFHNSYQKEIIRNEVNFFKKSTGGLGRLLQQGNLKKMYRGFQEIPIEADIEPDLKSWKTVSSKGIKLR